MSYYDDILQSVFDSALDREITTITIDGTTVKGFLRRNEKDETNPYCTLFVHKNYDVKQGALFQIMNTATNEADTYIIFKCLTAENSVYRKYQCSRCNQSIKIIYAKGDMVSYSCFETGFSDSLNTAKTAITISSTDTFIFPLNSDTKRIELNKRFLCGFYGQAWKVSDIQYVNGLCYVYAVRDSIQATDNTTDGIADYYQYYNKPDAYVITISEDSLTIDKGKTGTVTITVTKNGTAITTPVLTWINSDISVATIDASTNTITAISKGTATLTASYKVNDNDTCQTDKLIVNVTQAETGDIVITPAYNESNAYEKDIYDSATTFTASISGVSSPVWTITLNANGNPTSYYTVKIDNTNGTFSVQTLQYSSNYLIFTISEGTTGKSFIYNVDLHSAF